MNEMRRKDRAIEKEEAYEIIKQCEYGVLATVTLDGQPYCMPISPVVEGDSIYFHCALLGQKIDNIKKENRVCVTCVGQTHLVPEKFTTEYESAVVFGTAQMVKDEAEKIHALWMIVEKYAMSNMENAEKEMMASLSRTGVCKITIKSITGKAKRYPKNT